jgi:hypothetical protein
MEFRTEILEMLKTPFSWGIAEVLSIGLFFCCVVHAMRHNDEKTRVFRVLELFGYVLYSGVFENIGVLVKTFDRLLMLGVVPVAILMLEGAIFYASMQFAEKVGFPAWAIPFIVGSLCVLQDLTLDPVAVHDLQLVGGVLEGQWNWEVPYSGLFFGIPFFNYTGWFMMMVYYATLLVIGREYFRKSGYKRSRGYAYVLLSPLIGALLLVSPVTEFMLFTFPIVPRFTREAEIIMLSIVAGISLLLMVKYRVPRNSSLFAGKDRLFWLIPVILHAFDVTMAFILGIEIAFIPVVLFGSLHVGYLAVYYFWSVKRGKPASLVMNESVAR